MTQAGQARASAQPSAARPRRSWSGPLVAGLCFGLAFGATQRLIRLNVGELIRFGQDFDVQVFPGTSLESLRLRFGEADAQLRGDLELQELERRQEPAAARPVLTPADPATEGGGVRPAPRPAPRSADPDLEPLPGEEPLEEPVPDAPPAPTDELPGAGASRP
jgi:predicted lipid-binding transport protein (Tim44 family)